MRKKQHNNGIEESAHIWLLKQMQDPWAPQQGWLEKNKTTLQPELCKPVCEHLCPQPQNRKRRILIFRSCCRADKHIQNQENIVWHYTVPAYISCGSTWNLQVWGPSAYSKKGEEKWKWGPEYYGRRDLREVVLLWKSRDYKKDHEAWSTLNYRHFQKMISQDPSKLGCECSHQEAYFMGSESGSIRSARHQFTLPQAPLEIVSKANMLGYWFKPNQHHGLFSVYPKKGIGWMKSNLNLVTLKMFSDSASI